MGRRTQPKKRAPGWLPGQEAKLLDYIQDGHTLTCAAEFAGVSRHLAYNRRIEDLEFAARVQAATELGTDRLEREAKRRAVDGWEEPVFQKGEQVGVVRKYDSTLLMFLLNGRRPEKFRQNVRIDAPDLAVAFRGAMAKATAAFKLPGKGNGHDHSVEAVPPAV